MKKIISIMLVLLVCVFSGCSYSNSSAARETITLSRDNFEQYFSVSFSYSDLNESTNYFGVPQATAVLNVSIAPKSSIVSANNVIVEIGIGGGHWGGLSGALYESVHLDPSGYCNTSINVQATGYYVNGKESSLSRDSFVSEVSGTITV